MNQTNKQGRAEVLYQPSVNRISKSMIETCSFDSDKTYADDFPPFVRK